MPGLQFSSSMTTTDIASIVNALRGVLPADSGATPLHEPEFSGNEWPYVKECIDTGWVSSVGKFVDRFEADLAAFTGVRHAVATVNGTAALHVCLQLAGVKASDEVIIPALTFVATANAVSYTGATPHLVDSSAETLGLDPARLEEHLNESGVMRDGECFNRRTDRRIQAVVPMHTFGHPVDLDPLVDLCARWNLALIEDAAESLGSYYKGKHTGGFGRLAALSFNGNKVITTGGGGAILTNDAELAKLAKHVTTTAKTPHTWEYVHDQVGYNYRLPNLNAALGCAQLEELPRFLAQKRRLAEQYRDALQDIDGVEFFCEPSFAKSNYWLNTIMLKECDGEARDELLRATNAAGIGTRPAWKTMHHLGMYASCPRMDLWVAEDLEQRLINIPSSARLASGDSGTDTTV